MIWYEHLYIGESIPQKKIRRIKWKVMHNAGLVNIYLIVLCRSGTNLLEIFPARELQQKAYPKQQLYVVGLANGYQEAIELAARIVLEVYHNTGDFKVRQYLRNTGQKAGDDT